MPRYATLYFRSIREIDEHFRVARDLGFRPEIYFQYGWSFISEKAHRELAQKVLSEFSGCAVHLPYSGIVPGDEDRDGTMRDTLLRATDISTLYRPDHLVGHAFFNALQHSLEAPRKFFGSKKGNLTAAAEQPNQAWLDNSARVWREVISSSPARLFLENTYEHSPISIQTLLKDLPGHRASMCLDVGHWYYYAMGKHWENLSEWIDLCASRLGHLHLHDNDGTGDLHLSLGNGEVDFPLLDRLLGQKGLKPVYTIENHSAEKLSESHSYIRERQIFAGFGQKI
jgi:sugar phosphate isomerase/epimerase